VSLQNPALDIHHDAAALAEGPDGVGGPPASLENGKERIGVVFEKVVLGGNARVEFTPLLQPIEERAIVETLVEELAMAQVFEGKISTRVVEFRIDICKRVG
jgi:hypothetical protein